MINNYQYTFPQYIQLFPLVGQSAIFSNAFREALAITQAPESMVHLTALSVVSVALQGGIDVEVPTGKVCPVSLSTLIIADSGERKSTVENLLTKGIKSFYKDSTQNHLEKLNEYKIKQEVYENQINAIKKKGGIDDSSQANKMVEKLVEQQNLAPVKPKMPLLLFENSTIEALLNDLTINKPNAYLSSSEGGILFNSRLMSQTPTLNSMREHLHWRMLD